MNVEPIFLRTPFHRSKILTTETAARDPGSSVLVTLLEGGQDGALVTSLGAVPVGSSDISTRLLLYILNPGDAKAGLVYELSVTAAAAIAYGTLPNLDASRKGIWVPANSTLQMALSDAIASGVSVQIQGGYY
jgi:hypothetical protein